jgi:hypothetical protein
MIDAESQSSPVLLATVWCADCVSKHPGKLGEVYAFRDRVFFLASDPRNLRRHRHRRRRDPTWKGGYGGWQGTDGVCSTDLLPAWCKHHGEGWVAGGDLLGRRGNLVAKLRSARA